MIALIQQEDDEKTREKKAKGVRVSQPPNVFVGTRSK